MTDLSEETGQYCRAIQANRSKSGDWDRCAWPSCSCNLPSAVIVEEAKAFVAGLDVAGRIAATARIMPAGLINAAFVVIREEELRLWALKRRYGSRAEIEPDHPKHIEYWAGLTADEKATLAEIKLSGREQGVTR